MTLDSFTENDAAMFGARLDAFGETLSAKDQNFLTSILWDAEASPESGKRQRDDSVVWTFGEIAIAIHRAYMAPAISLSPQPLPRDFVRLTESRGDLV